jgi:hypothetical protein
MVRSTALALILSFLTLGAGDVFAQQQNEAEMWRNVAEAIPLGTKVKIQTLENKRVSGVLMRVDGTSVMVKRNSRRPEPAISIPFDDVAKIERENGGGGVNVAKAIGIGLAAGGGVILSLFLIALQFD